MKNVLILYSTVDGQTLKIGRRLSQVLESAGQRVDLAPIEAAPEADLARFDVLVLGASIRYGHHRAPVAAFVERHRALLATKPTAFFSVNLVARKPGRDQPETNPYCRRFLKQVRWRPTLAAVFAGRLDYPAYGRFDRAIIRLIMAITRGPTDPAAVVEFTDWDAVERFGQAVAGLTPPA